jgi:hypothetical protein
MRFADAERAQAYVKRVKARWESKYDQFEHQAMLDAFCARHGTGRDCETTKEKEMWLGWLGSFTLGWDAHKKYVAESLGRH